MRGSRIPIAALLANARAGVTGLVQMFDGLERETAEAMIRHAGVGL